MRALLKASLMLGWILALIPPVWVAKRFGWVETKEWLVQLCFRGLMRIIGLRCDIRGVLPAHRPLLLVSNHSSYLDIILLGAMLPVCFTPKAEIARWPLIGGICRLLDCAFIDRSFASMEESIASIRAALAQEKIVLLFPEATTSNGKHVMPFRSSLFAVAQEKFSGQPLMVQPVAIAYTAIRNLPIDSGQRPKIAWYGDMELVPHLSELLKLGSIQSRLTFLEPVDSTRFPDRKAMARHCQEVIAREIQAIE